MEATQTITDWDQLYPSRFMKAGEFQGKDWTLTISHVAQEELGGEGEKAPKAVVTFKGAKKQFVMNRTNGVCIKAMFGRDVTKWIGKRVTLYPAEVMDPFTGELTLAIRVRGSPDLTESISFSEKIGRKTVKFRMVKTGAAKPKLKVASEPPAPPPPPPPVEPPEEDELDSDEGPEDEDAPF